MSRIESKPSLTIGNHQQHVRLIISRVLKAADPAALTRKQILWKGSVLSIAGTTQDITQGRIYAIAVGKASLPMMVAAGEQLGEVLEKGIVITKSRDQDHLKQMLAGSELPAYIEVFGAGHPISDQRSVSATKRVMDLVDSARAGDLVLCLISGGASALLSQPLLPLDAWQDLVNALLASGCTINELNAVRKRLDTIKGGGLARRAAPARCVSLILSDVVGNPLDIIGSGPTVLDPDRPEAALQVLRRYHIEAVLPPGLWQQIETYLSTVQDEKHSERVESTNYIIGDIHLAAVAASKAAVELGFKAQILTSHLEGEAAEVGRVIAALAKDAPPGTCLLLGGETTVTLRGEGLGGRNQELSLSAAIGLDGERDVIAFSFATDGDDGPTDAAGAFVSGETVPRARSLGLDAGWYLDNNDSHHFFEQTGGLIQTGQTGTNVNDLICILKYPVSMYTGVE